jgi:hypothetical protein
MPAAEAALMKRNKNLDVAGTSHDQESLEPQGFPLKRGGGGIDSFAPLGQPDAP